VCDLFISLPTEILTASDRLFSLARSIASAGSRKSWAPSYEHEDCVAPRSPRSADHRKSFANTFLGPLRNTFRSPNDARPSSELLHGSSESSHSVPSSDRVSLSGLATHLSPSTPNLSPSTPALPLPLPSTRRRWTGSGQRPPATDLARTRHLSNPLPPPTQPIPPIPQVHFDPRPSSIASPMPIPSFTDDRSPSTPTDDSSSYTLLNAAAAAASKARPSFQRQRRPSKQLALPQLGPSPTSPELASVPWHQPSRARATMYTLSRARSTSAIPSATLDAHPEQPTAGDSEVDLIDPSLLSEGEGRCSVRGQHHTEVPTVSSLSSILPWLQDHDLDCIIPAFSNVSNAE